MKKFKDVYEEVRNEYLEPVKKEIIYNYIEKEKILKEASENINTEFNKDTLNFLTVARLVPQKAIDRIIRVHAKLVYSGYKHHFYVIGEGPEKHKLENLIEQCNVKDTFHLLGSKENPYPYVKNSDYFCLLSKFEGYGMVLEEAKILEKPIIITDTAAREAVEKYNNSTILENDEEKIYEGLKNIIGNKKEIGFSKTNEDLKNNEKQINKNNEENEQYDNTKIIESIEKLFDNAKNN